MFYTILKAAKKAFSDDEFLGALLAEKKVSSKKQNTPTPQQNGTNHFNFLNLSIESIGELITLNLCMSTWCSTTDYYNNWLEKYNISAGFEMIPHDQLLKFYGIQRYLIENVKLNHKNLSAEKIFKRIRRARQEVNPVCNEMKEMHKRANPTVPV